MAWVRNIVTFFCLSIATVIVAEEETPYAFKGAHFLVSYCDCDKDALSDVESLIAAMDHAVMQSGATVLDSSKWIFPPNGLTMVYLLSESHASIHTYPEYGACFVDLFTCGDHCSAEKFDAEMRAYLKPKSVNELNLVRTQEIQDRNVVQR